MAAHAKATFTLCPISYALGKVVNPHAAPFGSLVPVSPLLGALALRYIADDG